MVGQDCWRFLSLKTFFGLTYEYSKQVYEQLFLLQYYGGWSFIEAYNLPIPLRQWFVERLSNEIKKQNEQMEQKR